MPGISRGILPIGGRVASLLRLVIVGSVLLAGHTFGISPVSPTAPAPPPLSNSEQPGGTFFDDNGSLHEASIEAIAAAGITRGCNPPVNDSFCPDQPVTRGQMAAFLVRAFGLTDAGPGDLFGDDDGSVFEADIDRLGTAGFTRGCNPPSNDRYCPALPVSRAQLASFLTRALDLAPLTPPPALQLEPGRLGEFELGDPVAVVVAGLTAALGPPLYDEVQQPPTEPLPFGYAADDYFRFVSWDRPDVFVVFSDSHYYYRSDGAAHLVAISVGGADGGAIISTPELIRVGSTYGDLALAYGSDLEVVYAEDFDLWLFTIRAEPGLEVFGQLSGDPAVGGQTVIRMRTGADSSL